MGFLKGNTVVVPWDFSDMSKSALAKALELVGNADLIRVIHVSQLPSAMEPGVVWQTVTKESISTHSHESFEKYLEEQGLPDISFTTIFGDPGSMIAEFADEANAELIVISSHGRTGLKRMFIGSVAERVVRMAHCDVLVLRHR